MLVAELAEKIEANEERTLHTTLRNIAIAPDATHLEITGMFDGDSQESHVEFPLDELTESSLARFLDINKTYLHRCPPDLKTTNLNHWMRANADTEVALETSRGAITSVHAENLLVVPVRSTVGIIDRVFNPNDEIVEVRRDDKVFQVDIKVANSSVDVPNPDRVEGRPEVGDITHGGVRLLTYPQDVVAPTVTTYLHRIWCRNGMAEDYSANQIRLRGTTVPEVLAEMEQKSREVLSGLDERLQEYANMANTPVPGNASDFIFQVASERGVGTRILRRLMERGTQLPEDPSLYDVQNIFAEVANEGRFAAATQLQLIAGEMAFDTERMIHRCTSCERVL